MAAGDLNGDGIDDLVVGAPFEDLTFTDEGMIHVALGMPGGGFVPGAFPSIIQSMAGEPSEPGDGFGWTLTVADLDGDQFADLIIGVPHEDLPGAPDAGLVHILFGGPGGPLTGGVMLFTQAGLGDPSEPGDKFGWAIAAGDMDANGIDDLLVGAPTEDIGALADAGLVIGIGFAPGGGIIGVLPVTHGTFGVDVTEATDEFGFSVAVGDLNGDGFGDAIIGSPGEIRGGLADGGQVSIVPGGPGGLGTGPLPSFWSQNTAGILRGA
ncbi:MAG: FG-GAP repeat protein [Phycisphaerales bacterium]